LIPYCLVKLRKDKSYAVFNPVSEQDREIDFAGYRILELCDGVLGVEEIAKIIACDLKLEQSESLIYVIDFLDRMSGEGMIAWRDQSSYKIRLPAPKQVFWDITRKCNLRCAHCYNSDVNSYGQEVSTEEVKRTLDEIRRLGVEHVTYSGGEPFMRDDFAEIAVFTASLGFASVSVATNGTYINSDTASQLKHPNLSIQVSIDGDTAEVHDRIRGVRGSYNSAIRALQVLMEEGVNTKVCTTVTKLNVETVPRIIELMDHMGVRNYRFQGMLPGGRGKGNAGQIMLTPDRMKSLVEYLVSRNLDPGGLSFTLGEPPNEDVDFSASGACSAGYSTCSITPDGTVVPCTYFWGTNGENVRFHSFQWIWENSTVLNYFRSIRLDEIKGACRQCAWFMRCHGGCRAETYLAGDLFGSNRNCWVAGECERKTAPTASPGGALAGEIPLQAAPH